MRTIQVSTGVFGRIWAARREGEESEDAILNRLLGGEPAEAAVPSSPNSSDVDGHRERSYGVQFPGGFQIFRTYLGQSYRAKAVSLGWVLENNGQAYPTLNELSKAIGVKVENAWAHWFFRTPEGERKAVAALRDPGKVARRTRGPVDVNKLFAELDKLPDAKSTQARSE